MVLGLTSLGEGRTKSGPRLTMGLAHAAGGLAGGVAMAMLGWILATPVRTLLGSAPSRLILVVAFAIAVAIDLGLLDLHDRTGQADPSWRARFGHAKSYFLYGVLFGFGWATLKPSAVFYSVVALAALAASPIVALTAGAAFGLGRTMLVYPGSFVATAFSRLLSRGRLAAPIWHGAGAATSGLYLLALIVAT